VIDTETQRCACIRALARALQITVGCVSSGAETFSPRTLWWWVEQRAQHGSLGRMKGPARVTARFDESTAIGHDFMALSTDSVALLMPLGFAGMFEGLFGRTGKQLLIPEVDVFPCGPHVCLFVGQSGIARVSGYRLRHPSHEVHGRATSKAQCKVDNKNDCAALLPAPTTE
jgi:hypothetical protein